ncbi:MAG: hypothetical protein WCI73_17405, partial [Phycisphaerae bacterium]
MAAFVIENRIFEPDECLAPAQRRDLQTQRLRQTMERVANVPFYKNAFARSGGGLRPDMIQSPAEVRKLPFTTKEDLRQHYPLGFCAVPREQIARIHGSSGTTGKPTFVAYTKEDLNTWSSLCARFLVAGGLRPEHFVHIAFGYGLFTGGFGLHYGIEKVGAAIVPAAGGDLALADPKGDPRNGLPVPPQTALTIGDTLSAKNVSWAWFGGAYNEASAEAGKPDAERKIIYKPGTLNYQPHHQPFNYYSRYAPGTAERAAQIVLVRPLTLEAEGSLWEERAAEVGGA